MRTRSLISVILLGLALCLPARARAQAPNPPQAPTGGTSILGPATVSLQRVQSITARSPLLAVAQEIISFGAQHNINPAFALAIWTHESSLDTAGASVANHNPGNLICAAAHPPAFQG